MQGSLLIVGFIVSLEIAALAIAHWSIFEVQPVPSGAGALAYQPANTVKLSRSENLAAMNKR
jgi:hypothetical protein